jgi:hypothetical protein
LGTVGHSGGHLGLAIRTRNKLDPWNGRFR